MFLTLLCILTEDKVGEVVIVQVDMAYGEQVVGVKRAPNSPDCIAGMLNGDIVFISICFMIIYRTNKQDSDLKCMFILCVYNASGFLIMFMYRVTI